MCAGQIELCRASCPGPRHRGRARCRRQCKRNVVRFCRAEGSCS
jgi:hypothetical protein